MLYYVTVTVIHIKAKKLIICFSGTARVAFNPCLKNFYCISSICMKNLSICFQNCQFKMATCCHHFILIGWLISGATWLVHILKVRNVGKVVGSIVFISKGISKNKNKNLPSCFILISEKQCLRKILLIFGLTMYHVLVECTLRVTL